MRLITLPLDVDHCEGSIVFRIVLIGAILPEAARDGARQSALDELSYVRNGKRQLARIF